VEHVERVENESDEVGPKVNAGSDPDGRANQQLCTTVASSPQPERSRPMTFNFAWWVADAVLVPHQALCN
jgi:hypothetical protein